MDREFIAAWNEWRKRDCGGWVHYLLVLFKIIESPTLQWVQVDRAYRAKMAAHSARRETNMKKGGR